jgi:hypothetical protein
MPKRKSSRKSRSPKRASSKRVVRKSRSPKRARKSASRRRCAKGLVRHQSTSKCGKPCVGKLVNKKTNRCVRRSSRLGKMLRSLSKSM